MIKLFTITMERDEDMEIYRIATPNHSTAIELAYHKFALLSFQPEEQYDDEGVKYDPIIPNQFELNGRMKTLQAENCMTEMLCEDLIIAKDVTL